MIVLDTHILVWLVSDPEKIPLKIRKALNKEMKKGHLLVSSISVWEICMLVKKGRLKFSMDVDSWMEKVEELSFIQFVPVDNNIAAKSVSLPGKIIDDPADRIIIATAREMGASLATYDKRILKYYHVQTL